MDDGASVATKLDADDPLASFANEFVATDPDLIYLDGNSLGRMPGATKAVVEDIVNRQWPEQLIRSWGDGWWDMQLQIGEMLAPIVGAQPDEIIISDSTSVNLYKLAGAALSARPGRSKIVTDDMNFPTDLYVLEGLVRTMNAGHHIEIVESRDGIGPVDALVAAIDETTALVTLSHTVFKSGYTYDMARIADAAHASGALVLFDLSHSVGVLEIVLNAATVDLAVGCTYKYLNGGPGSPAFLYVHKDLQADLTNPITGWWGHANPFAFDVRYDPTDGMRKFHTGTMPILSLATIAPALEITTRAGMDAIRRKSVKMTEYFISLFDVHLAPLGFGLNSPRDPAIRGSHISLTHAHAWQITRALVEKMDTIPDFREPDNLRLGFSPLYQSFSEIHTAAMRMRQVVEEKIYEGFPDHRTTVT